MTAVDTNILVRFLVRDHEAKAQRVRDRFKSAEKNNEILWISQLVVLELIWVLESAYKKSRTEIVTTLQQLRQIHIFEFESGNAIDRMILDATKYKADISDILIGHTANQSGCKETITFDLKAAKLPLFKELE
jgi:predicted nucleic-acid-binding protein